jgi:hypothetical protein
MYTLKQLQSGELKGLKEIKISENLTTFPQELFAFADTLELLDLSNNKLSELPEDFYRFKKLKIAFFSFNEFREVPTVFKECHNLFMLGFKKNKIEHFAEDILPLSISWLILTDNRLQKLPDSIGELTKMQKFPLAGNRLTSLPQSMQNLKNLELMRLSANNLEKIPEFLLSLPKLAWLAFSGNPCSVSKESRIKVLALKDLEMDKLLGEGASGKIYRGHSDSLNRVVAVKLFKGAITSDGYAKDEMNACMQAGDHPNLIKVLARLEQKHLGLVLEFIAPSFKNLGNPPSFESCSRDTYASNFSLTPQEILKVVTAISSVAAHLHAKGIMHGDLYAHNILVDENFKSYLGDFGAASFYESKESAYEQLEVLAFGNLLEDLLKHTSTREGTLYEKLENICKKTQTPQVNQRPLFEALHGQLIKLFC